MDRSSDYRLKVEDQNLTQFHSDKSKVADWFQTLRNGKVPKSLRASFYKDSPFKGDGTMTTQQSQYGEEMSGSGSQKVLPGLEDKAYSVFNSRSKSNV